jgi:hypothetical protein
MYPSSMSYTLIYASLLLLLPGREFPTNEAGTYMPIGLSGRPGPTRPKAVAGPAGVLGPRLQGHEENAFCLVLTLRTSPHSTSEDSEFVVGSLPLVGWCQSCRPPLTSSLLAKDSTAVQLELAPYLDLAR